MRTAIMKRVRLGLLAALILVSAASLAPTAPAEAQTPPRVGMVCKTGPSFTFTAHSGYINLPDGNSMFMWGYSEGSDGFQHPGPVLCVNEGDTVTIILKNDLDQDVSIMFPGQDNVLANGAPVQPQFDGGNLTSLTNVAQAFGGSITYSFVANHPGSFIYESGTDPGMQVGMGLFGVLIVRPTMGADHAYNRADSRFTPSEEFLTLLSEIDPYQHQAVEQGRPFNMNNYHPRYWLLNGRGFPDTIADNFAARLPTQPYGALLRIHEFNDTVSSGDPNYHPYPGLAHFISVGTEDYPFHPHANNGIVIGRDGRPLEGPGGEDLSFEKFAINVGPGQTWDVLFKWYDAENYDATTNPVPITIPNLANQELGPFYGASPYLGTKGTLPPGVSTLNQCGEYYIISHNHALHQLSTWGGGVMQGPITYLRIDPPLPNTCP